MPLLGNGGILELSREWPPPLALSKDGYNVTTKRIDIPEDGYWTGDQVQFTSANGIPLDLNGDGYADNPDGHGIYRGSIYELGPARGFYTGPETNEDGPHYQIGSLALKQEAINYDDNPVTLTVTTPNFYTGRQVTFATTQGIPVDYNNDGFPDCPDGLGVYVGSYWLLGPARTHLTTENGAYYVTGNDAVAFYNTPATTGLTTIFTAYITKDSNNKVRFFETADPSSPEIEFLRAACGNIVLALTLDFPSFESDVQAMSSAIAPLELTANEQILELVVDVPTSLAFDYYNRPETTGFATYINGYVNIDALGRAKFYSDEIGAHNADTADLLNFRAVDCGNFVIAPYSSNNQYQSALLEAANAIAPLTLPAPVQHLDSVIDLPAGIDLVYTDADERGWYFQGNITDWALNIDASTLDMTAIGETFGEATKALVKGSGSMSFIMDQYAKADTYDPLTLLRLVLLTQDGSKVAAKFYIMKDRDSVNCDASSFTQLGGSLYYKTDILLSGSNLNLRATDLVQGSTDFVATGDIDLIIEAAPPLQ